ncbi:amidase family protein [Amycolatopsis sp. NBC_00345]|uniref:amidase family protein n=1 Tax=Amycolatopsis sp. NBC_00345 TaxID=2975955 RepID=UPI002E2725CF
MTRPPPVIAELVAGLTSGRLSARELLDQSLDRIGRYNDGLRLVTTIDERAPRWAREADDAAARGESLGPMHGIPVTVKDSFATEGLRTTAGLPELAGHTPAHDADVVQALRRAGAVVFGKTNLAAGCADVQADNPLFGAAANPWDPAYTTGGSSGGSAGAVAAGFSVADVGSDIAGSIRIPAAACGVFGHRPSFGIVPMRGHIPPLQPIEPDLAVAGPLAANVADLETLLDVLVGPGRHDRPAWRVELPAARTIRRVAIWDDDPYCHVDAEIRGALATAATALAGAGVQVEPRRPTGIRLDESDSVARRLLASVALKNHRPADLAAIAAGTRPPGDGLGDEFAAQSYAEWMTADARRERLRARWHSFFTDFDAILLPVGPALVGRHDDRPFAERRIVVDGVERPYWDQLPWTSLTGLARLPTTVVPVQRDSRGLPIGIAVAGPYLEDRTTLQVARLLSEAFGPLGRPDLDLAR